MTLRDSTTLKTYFNTGDTPTETNFADMIDSLAAFMAERDVGARVYHDADQSINDATTTALALNSERYNANGFHDTETNNSRLTVPAGQGGKYLITGHVLFAANTTGQRALFIALNGITTFLAAQTINASSTGGIQITLSTIYELAATDYVQLVAYQASGGSLNITASASRSPEFAIQRIG